MMRALQMRNLPYKADLARVPHHTHGFLLFL